MALHKDQTGDDLHPPKAHASTHASGGTDEINVSAISFGSTDLKPSALPGSLMQLLWELPGIIATLESKIELIAADADIDITFPV